MTDFENLPLSNRLHPELVMDINSLSDSARSSATKLLDLLSDTIRTDTAIEDQVVAHSNAIHDSGSMIEAHVPLIERLYERAGLIPKKLGAEAVSSSPEIVSLPEPVKEVNPVERLELTVHRRTPVNMRNFLSEVYPVEKNEDVFSLGPAKSAILSDVLLKLYFNASGTGQRMRSRRKSAETFEKFIDLRAQEKSPEELAQAAGLLNTAKIHASNKKVTSGIEKYISLEDKLEALEIIESGVVVSINELIDRIEDASPAVSLVEPEPVDEGQDQIGEQIEDEQPEELNEEITRYTFTDTSGESYVMSFNSETYEISINGLVFESSKTNVYRDRFLLIKALIDNPSEKFSNSKFHEFGVASTTRTKGARSQAIKCAINEAFDLTIPTVEGNIALIDFASPRTYRLHPFFGGVVEDVKVPVPVKPKPEKPVFDADKPVQLKADRVEIKGLPYELYNGEIGYLREIVSVERRLTAVELSRLTNRTSNPSSRDIEDTEETMFELFKRGIVSETHEEHGITYSINKDIEDFRSRTLEIELDGEPIFLDKFDRRIVKFMLNMKGPIQIKEIARNIGIGDYIDNSEYDRLARTVKKYLNPHQLVKRIRNPKGRGYGSLFFIPDVIKGQLREII